MYRGNIPAFHALTSSELYSQLQSSEDGLTATEAAARLTKYGPNKLAEESGSRWIYLLISQFTTPLVYILAAAGVISYLADHAADAIIIAIVVIVNALIGFVQEYRAEKSIDSLKKLIVLKAKVLRDGKLVQIDSALLVPGDVIVIEEGDKIPADARLLSVQNFRTIESAITGESVPTDKEIKPQKADSPMADRKNMVWMSSACTAGKAKAIVVGTGSSTIIGQIATSLKNIREAKSHFEEITGRLAKQMAMFAIAGSIIIFLVGYVIRGIEFQEIFLFSIASLVSAIPEGLPAVLTIVLAIGAYRMAQKNAIVRDLSASETLGIVNVVATDKTGTLTQNTMTIKTVWLPGAEEYVVTGEGWASEGVIQLNGKDVDLAKNPNLQKLIETGFQCNTAQVIADGGKYNVMGDPTEAAFVVLGNKAGMNDELKDKVIFDIPFDTTLKYRASLVAAHGSNEIMVLGAPEKVIELCGYVKYGKEAKHLDNTLKAEMHSKITQLSSDGLRVIGLAAREYDNESKEITHKQVQGLTLIGLVGMKDPVRPEVKDAVSKAHEAGIRVIMLTGDHKATAKAIASEIDLTAESSGEALAEDDLVAMDDHDFAAAVRQVNIFARLSPQMKLRIAKTLQSQGNVVAMTGDGVNDAPVLKQADVGIAMGIMGTDTAREASEIILADDNFASIISAIQEGRLVFNNVQRASTFLVTTNVAEQLTILLNIALGYPLPLLASQILWLNLVTDGVNDFALATEKDHGDALKVKPRSKRESILGRNTIFLVIVMSIIMMVLTFGFFVTYLDAGLTKARTIAFLCMSFTQLFNALNLRSFTHSIFEIGVFSNKFVVIAFTVSALLNVIAIYFEPLRNLLSFEVVEVELLLVIITASTLPLWVGEVIKWIRRPRRMALIK